jgi:hypothetical protein
MRIPRSTNSEHINTATWSHFLPTAAAGLTLYTRVVPFAALGDFMAASHALGEQFPNDKSPTFLGENVVSMVLSNPLEEAEVSAVALAVFGKAPPPGGEHGVCMHGGCTDADTLAMVLAAALAGADGTAAMSSGPRNSSKLIGIVNRILCGRRYAAMATPPAAAIGDPTAPP